MATRGGAVHVVTTRREKKGKVYLTHLLRRSFREDGKVKNETLSNLSHLPDPAIDAIRRILRGEELAPVGEVFEITGTAPHGDVHAVQVAMRQLGFFSLLSSRPCREVQLVAGMVAARIVAPHTKLATTRWWKGRTLAEDLGIVDATEDDLYAAMDWLLGRQKSIEKKLAARHLDEKSFVLYDLSSSYFEGKTCPLAKLGHNRDGKTGKLQVNYGLLTDRRGCPVSVSVFDGATGDPKTLMPQVLKLREDFGIGSVVLVGDRGMISQKAIKQLRKDEGLQWITALRSTQIRTLVEGGQLQLGLFDERNLFEMQHPGYPGERLVACRNTVLGRLRAHKRASLLEATTRELEKVRGMVARGKLRGRAEIGLRAGRVVNKYKVAKHFKLSIADDSFSFAVKQESVSTEAALDGLYVVRTNLSREEMSADDAVRTYKGLSKVERAFRTMKSIDLKVRPIHHRLADRVKAHILLCTLAYYVEWHMREAWRPILFADEDQAAKDTRDPVAPAMRSAAAEVKAQTHTLPDGTPTHCFRTLMENLSTIARNTCRTPSGGEGAPTFRVITSASPMQRRALDLLESIKA